MRAPSIATKLTASIVLCALGTLPALAQTTHDGSGSVRLQWTVAPDTAHTRSTGVKPPARLEVTCARANVFDHPDGSSQTESGAPVSYGAMATLGWDGKTVHDADGADWFRILVTGTERWGYIEARCAQPVVS